MEQLGQAWVKHGFASPNGNFCGTCQTPASRLCIGVNCSDPYGNQQNGVQVDLAPKSEVNAATGYFPIPYNGSPAIPPTTGRRLQARHVDLDPALTPARSTSSRSITWPGRHRPELQQRLLPPRERHAERRSYNISFSGANPTQAQKPAIQAWKDYDPNVAIMNVDVPGDGRLIMAFLATDNGNGTTHYEYAVHNLCSDRSLQALSIAMPPARASPTSGSRTSTTTATSRATTRSPTGPRRSRRDRSRGRPTRTRRTRPRTRSAGARCTTTGSTRTCRRAT